jgi:hypothetical protein
MMRALRNADAAGEYEDAKRIAAMIKAADSSASGQAAQSPGGPVDLVAAGLVGPDAPDEFKFGYVGENGQIRPAQKPSAAQTFVEGVVDGFPIVGPSAVRGARNIAATITAPITGRSVEQGVAASERQSRLGQREHPIADVAGNVTGAIAGLAPLAVTGAGASALGITGRSLLTQTGKAVGSTAAIEAADTAVRGGDAEDILTNAAIGGGIAAAIPGVGRGVRALREGRAARKGVNRGEQITREAMNTDKAVNPNLLSADELRAARSEGLPVVNADAGGGATHGVLKSSSNLSQEARAMAAAQFDERALQQAPRTIAFIRGIEPGENTLSMLDDLRQQAAKINAPAYEKAFAGNFQSGSDKALADLLDSVPPEALRNAMKVAKAEGRPFGQQLVASIDDANDLVSFSRAPSLREWHYIQRGLRGAADSAYRSGVGEVGSAYKALHRNILGAMDAANPAYAKARAGASKAFGEQDAFTAGKALASSNTSSREVRKAMLSLSDPERKMLRIGYATDLIDTIAKRRDVADVIGSTFGNPAAREKFAAVFGKKAARKLEARIRVEAAMLRTQRAFGGNSTTVQQAVDAFKQSGDELFEPGYFMVGTTAGVIANVGRAVGRAAVKKGHRKLTERVQREAMEVLLSNDPARIDKLIGLASFEPQWIAAVDFIAKKMPAAQGVGIGSTQVTE